MGTACSYPTPPSHQPRRRSIAAVPDLEAAVTQAMGSTVVQSVPVHGGDVARSHRMDLADGRRVFAKTHAAPPPWLLHH